MSISLPNKFRAWRKKRISPLAKCFLCQTIGAKELGELCPACEISKEQVRERITNDIERYENVFCCEFNRVGEIWDAEKAIGKSDLIPEAPEQNTEEFNLLLAELEEENQFEKTIALEDHEYSLDVEKQHSPRPYDDLPTQVLSLDDIEVRVLSAVEEDKENDITHIFDRPSKTLVWEREDELTTELPMPIPLVNQKRSLFPPTPPTIPRPRVR